MKYGHTLGEFFFYINIIIFSIYNIFYKIFFVLYKTLSVFFRLLYDLFILLKDLFLFFFLSLKNLLKFIREKKYNSVIVSKNIKNRLNKRKRALKKEDIKIKIILSVKTVDKFINLFFLKLNKFIKNIQWRNTLSFVKKIISLFVNFFNLIFSLVSLIFIFIKQAFIFLNKKIIYLTNFFSGLKNKNNKECFSNGLYRRNCLKKLFNFKILNKKKEDVSFPLYFRWELVLRRVSDAKKHIVGPFKKYWQYSVAVIVLIVFVSTTMFMYSGHNVYAAVYNWDQSDWSGGVSEENPDHDNNQNNWNKYSSKDENILAGSDISLGIENNSFSDTLNNDFNSGTLLNDVVASNDSLTLDSDFSFTDWSDKLIASFSTSRSYGVYALGNYVYIADYAEGLKIIDVSDPSSPFLAGFYDTNGSSNGVYVLNNYAYVGDGSGGLKIIDVSDPTSPNQVGEYVSSGNYSYYVYVEGDYAYIANGSIGLEIVDISDKTNPIFVGIFDTYKAKDVAISDNYAYVADDTDGFKIIDISDKTNPVLTSSLDPASTVYGISYENNYIYLADTGDKLKIIDVSDPVNPFLTGEVDLEDDVNDVYVSGNYAYAAVDNNGFKIVDISDKTNPLLKGSVGLFQSEGISVLGDYVYIADYTDGLKIIDISEFNFLDIIGSVSTNYSRKVKVDDDYAYIADYNDGLKIVDISDKTNPTIVGEIDTNGSTNDLFILGDYAYLADYSSGLKIVDISDKTNPTIVGEIDTNRAFGISVSGDYVYIADYSEGLKIIDVSDKTNPVLVGNFLTSYAYDTYVSGDYVYVADGALGLDVVDVSDKENPFLVKNIDTPGSAYSVFIEGNYLYLADAASGFIVFDITDPINTNILSSYDSDGSCYDVFASGDYAYIADYTNGVKIINIRDKTSLKIAANINTEQAYGVYYLDNYLYIADYGVGLKISSVSGYKSSGIFVSQIFDTVVKNEFGTSSWSVSLEDGTNLSLKVRSDDNDNMSGANDWDSCSVVNNGDDISLNSCISDTDRYIQYMVEFLSNDSSVTPILEDVTLNYNKYPSQQSLISSPYNAGSDANILAGIEWVEDESLENGTGVKMYVRTNSSLELLNTSDWEEVASSSYTGTLTTGCSKDGGDVSCGEGIIPESMKDGVNDQWMQYKVELLSDGTGTANVDDIVMIYVVNAPPEIQNVSASQGSDGLVSISYEIRDIDGTTGSITPEYVTPSFEYWNGTSWVNCESLSDGAINNKAVDEVNWNEYSLTWNPVADFNNQYKNNTAKIRVTINDNEAANNTAVLESNIFILDTKDPVINSVVIDARDDAENILSFSVSDDSLDNLKIKISNNGDLSSDGSNINSGEWINYSATSTWVLPNNSNSIYYQVKDEYGNISSNGSTSFTVFPEEPGNFVFQDVSNTETLEWREFIAWGVVSEPNAGFKNYNILRSTDGENYTVLETETDRLVNYYIDSNIDTGIKYYYKVTVEDDNGNFSRYSEVVSDTVDGQGGSDLTSPTISNVSISDISAQSAVISWDTNELSDSTVEYITIEGGDFSNAQTVGVTTMSDSNSGLGGHSVVLSSLTPGETYYFQVKSSDPSGNTATNKQGENGYSFTTLSGPTIENVNVSNVSNNKVTIFWETNIESDSYIIYSTSADLTNSQQVGIDESVLNHSVDIEGLISGGVYYYYVKSGVAEDKNVVDGEIRYYSFSLTSDTTSPNISEVSVSPVSDVLAVVNWETDELSDSVVNYGTETGMYSLVASSTRMNIEHSLTLDELNQNTTYYYTISSSDSNGNSTTTEESSFSTLETLSEESDVVAREEAAREDGEANAPSGGGGILIIDKTDKIPPTISDIKIEDISSNYATISWTTDEEADSYIEYGLSLDYDNTNGFRSKTINHLVKIDDLFPSTQYYYKVTSSDGGGNLTESEDLIFTTLSIEDGIEKEIEDNLDEDNDYNERERSENEENNQENTQRSARDLFDIANKAAKRAIDIIRGSASGLNLGFIESSVKEQENSLQELADLLPMPVMSGSPVVITSDTTATIEWKTDRDSNSLVAISSEKQYNPESNKPYLQVIGDPLAKTTNHSVTIYQLEPNTVYHYQLRNKPSSGSEARSRDFTFKTDLEVLGIKNYVIQNVSTEEAVFKWVTSSEAKSSVRYTPYVDGELNYNQSRTKSSDLLTTIHEIRINDLEAGVIYDIELISKDLENNIITETIKSFLTAEGDVSPSIDQVQTTSAIYPGKNLKIQTVISWLTNEPSTSKVYYQKGVAKPGEELKESTILDENYTKKHVVVVTKFDPGEIYSFQTESVDSGGNISLSKIYTILTPKQEESVFQVIIKNLESVFGWVNQIN